MNDYKEIYEKYFTGFGAPCQRCKTGYGKFDTLAVYGGVIQYQFYCRACGQYFVHSHPETIVKEKKGVWYLIYILAGRAWDHGQVAYIKDIKTYKELKKRLWGKTIWQKIKNLTGA